MGNWQEGENNCGNHFIINIYESNVAKLRFNLATSVSAVRHTDLVMDNPQAEKFQKKISRIVPALTEFLN